MSYTKQTWQAGDEITSAKLNHLEDGINNVATEVANFPVEVNNPQDGDTLIYNAAEQKWVSGSNNGGSGGGFLKVGLNIETRALDKTWKEIYDAICAGYYVSNVTVSDVGGRNAGELALVSAFEYEGESGNMEYKLEGLGVEDGGLMILNFVTNSENGYPVINGG